MKIIFWGFTGGGSCPPPVPPLATGLQMLVVARLSCTQVIRLPRLHLVATTVTWGSLSEHHVTDAEVRGHYNNNMSQHWWPAGGSTGRDAGQGRRAGFYPKARFPPSFCVSVGDSVSVSISVSFCVRMFPPRLCFRVFELEILHN